VKNGYDHSATILSVEARVLTGGRLVFQFKDKRLGATAKFPRLATALIQLRGLRGFRDLRGTPSARVGCSSGVRAIVREHLRWLVSESC
jgi:hypothetical protein